ncbi:peroxisomal sarcosine oxidase-like isoform X1 [Asterias rubens]|uniref:peroxisomal sarcosine oxidase-like isoform X1 n=2 Tax=Asterias rubens TaxID=7604 RepID=UPI0014557A73|nr:peroxisomal sarcosine oxidase-like isoform X1 [Asterias rubens]
MANLSVINQTHYDCIVIGAGIEGSATCYQLTKKGVKTLLIEQFKLGHDRGSSHGQSRITRHAYLQKHYAMMMPECFETWARLEQEVGTKLYRNVGLLSVNGPPYKDYNHRGGNLQDMNKPIELLTARQVCQRWPGFSFQPEMKAFVDPSGGVLYADRCLKALQTMVVKQGAIIREEEKVLQIIPGKHVTIITDRGRYTAKSVVLTPGSWASQLLRPLGLYPPLKLTRIKVCYWSEKQPGMLSNYPCFYFLSGKFEIYGLPTSAEYPGLFKVCNHRGQDFTDPEETRTDYTEDIDQLKEFIKTHVPGLVPEPAIIENCIYTSTPNEEIILDRHPDHPNIIVGCGFSGHGFKLAPVVGKILSELATGEKPSYAQLPLRLQIFQKPGATAKL